MGLASASSHSARVSRGLYIVHTPLPDVMTPLTQCLPGDSHNTVYVRQLSGSKSNSFFPESNAQVDCLGSKCIPLLYVCWLHFRPELHHQTLMSASNKMSFLSSFDKYFTVVKKRNTRLPGYFVLDFLNILKKQYTWRIVSLWRIDIALQFFTISLFLKRLPSDVPVGQPA